MARARAKDTGSLPSLAGDIQRLLGMVVLRDVAFDPATGMLTAVRLDTSGPDTAVQFEVGEGDRAWLADAAGRERVRCALRLTSGEGNVRLTLLGCRGGTAWEHGAMIDLDTPSYALEKLAARNRLTELGKQCAAVAHEIRQPLSTIALASENLRLSLRAQPATPPEAMAALDHILGEVEQAHAIIEQTLNYAAGRGAAGQPESVADLARAVSHALRMLSYQMERGEIAAVRTGLDGDLPVAMPQIELEQILLNILRNGIESILTRKGTGWRGNGAIGIAVDDNEDRLRCTISDNGAGVSPTQRECGFQPFVTTKGSEGNGLGLYICEELLAKAGGYLRLLPGDPDGAKVEIVVPRSCP